MSRDWLSPLDERGFYVAAATSLEGFAEPLAELYDIIEIEQVREVASSTSDFHSNRAMSMHTDHCDADRVAWWCKQPAAAGGESLLLDARPLLRELTHDELRDLSQVAVDLPRADPVPLLQLEDGSLRVYYASWLVREPDDVRVAASLARFEHLIHSAAPLRFRLEAGQWLIIDNHRVLHGRAEFTANTDRHLLRLWLRTKRAG